MILRSLFFQIGLVPITLVFLPLEPMCLFLSIKQRYAILRLWGRSVLLWLKWTCGITYEVEGRENIPSDAGIVLSKHQSAWETIALQSVFPAQVWVMKRSLFWIPIFGWGLALVKSIGIDRKAGKQALQQVVDQGIDRLQLGLWVVVFPEGTRMAPGQTGRYAIGGALLAEKSGRPVVPVAHNAGEHWPKKGFLKRPGIIRMVVGPAIDSKGRKAAEINAMARDWIEGVMPRISAVGRESLQSVPSS